MEDGETCDIAGVGPIPVASARALAADCILKVLVTKGVDGTELPAGFGADHDAFVSSTATGWGLRVGALGTANW